jgi:hypothetical protein
LDLDVDDGIDVLSKKSVATVHDQTISIVANDSTYSLEELQVA